MSNAWYEVLSVLHLMAMLSLSHANLLLLPRTSSDGYQPKVSEGDWWRWWADGFGGSMTAVVVVVESATINRKPNRIGHHQHHHHQRPNTPTSIQTHLHHSQKFKPINADRKLKIATPSPTPETQTHKHSKSKLINL